MKATFFFRSGMASALMAMCCTAAFCANPTYKEAVSDFTAGKYKVALDKFSILQKSASQNSTLRYYKAMCLQNLGQLAESKQEYTFVANYGDPGLKAYAIQALDRLNRQSKAAAAGTPYTFTGMGMLTTVTPDQRGMVVKPPPPGNPPPLK